MWSTCPRACRLQYKTGVERKAGEPAGFARPHPCVLLEQLKPEEPRELAAALRRPRKMVSKLPLKLKGNFRRPLMSWPCKKHKNHHGNIVTGLRFYSPLRLTVSPRFIAFFMQQPGDGAMK